MLGVRLICVGKLGEKILGAGGKGNTRSASAHIVN